MKNFKKPLVVASFISLASATGLARADVAEAISSAFSTGTTNLGIAVTGVITMVCVVTGIGLIVSMLRK